MSPQGGDPSQPIRPRVVTKSPAKAFFDVGTSLLRQGRAEDAQFYLREALRLQPDDPDTLNNLGTAVWLAGRAEEADLGSTLARQGKWDEALVCYNRALGLQPCYDEARLNRAHIWLAHGDFERGWPEFEWRLSC